MDVQIIGVAGTNGAGKDTAGLLLAEKHNYIFISVTDIMRDELRLRDQPVDREHLRTLSAQWRETYGLGVLVDKAVAVYSEASHAKRYDGLVIASIRNPYEVDRIHELNGTVWWVDADPRLRYDRVQAANRGRGAEDHKTFQQFLDEQEAEMHGDGKASSLDMSAVQKKSDVFIRNDSHDKAVLDAELSRILANGTAGLAD